MKLKLRVVMVEMEEETEEMTRRALNQINMKMIFKK